MGDMNKQQQYEHVIGAAYDAVLKDDSWGATLHSLMVLTGAQAGAFLLADTRHAGALMCDTVGLEAAMLDEYNREYSKCDPNLDYKLRHPGAACLVDRRILAPEVLAKGPFHQEFMRRYELSTSMALTLHCSDSALIGSFSVHRKQGGGEFDQASIDWAMRALPHLRRALALHSRAGAVREAALHSQTMLDCIATPVLLLEQNDQVLAMNRAAAEALMAEPRLSLRGGRLPVSFAPGRCASHYQLDRPDGKGPLHLYCVPVAADSALASHWQRPLRLVMLDDPGQLAQGLAPMLMSLYGLTQAEARVCLAMTQQNLAPQQCAELFAVSIHTVRTQIKAIQAKTGIKRSAELARMVNTLALLGAPGTRH